MEPVLCKYCNKHYPPGDFGVAKTIVDKVYRRRKCRYCYRATKQRLIDRYASWLDEIKRSRGCKMCNITDSRVLDFHHRESESKLFTVGGFRNSIGIERVKDEIKKCDIVCANCHRILHSEMRKARRGQREQEGN